MDVEGKQQRPRSLVVLPRELGHQLPTESEVGAKAHHLTRLLHLKSRVPRFGLLRADAFDAHMASDSVAGPYQTALDCHDDAALAAAGDVLMTAVRSAPLSTQIRNGLDELVDAFTDADLLAVRPSVVGPAGEVLVMSGLLETFLFVRGKAAVREAVHLAFASAFAPATLAARIDAGLDPMQTRCAIILQRMVMADSSGAVASLDIDAPAGRPPQTIVEATLGLGGGSSRPKTHLSSDIFRVSRPLLADEGLVDNASVESEIVKKRQALVLDDAQGHGSVLSTTDPKVADSPTLTTVQARVVAEEALRLESATGRPVALEFAFSGRLLHILQLHPLETPEGKVSSTTERVFDARVLPEDISGPALPATQSLVRATVTAGLKKALVALGAKKPFPVDVARALDRVVATVDRDLVGNVGALKTAVNVLGRNGWPSAAMGHALGSEDFDPTRAGEVARTELSNWGLIRASNRTRKDISALQEDATATLSSAFEDSERIRFSNLDDSDPDRLADQLDELVTLTSELRALQWRARLLWAFARDLLQEQAVRAGIDVSGAWLDDMCTPVAATSELGLVRKIDKLVKTLDDTPVVQSLFAQDPNSESLLERLADVPDAKTFAAGFGTTVEHDGIHLAERGVLEAPTFEERPDLLLDFIRRQAKTAPSKALEKRLSDAEGRRKKAEYLASSQAVGRSLLLFKHDALLFRLSAATKDAAAVNIIASRLCGRVAGVFRHALLALGARLYEHDLVDQPADIMWLALSESIGVVRGSTADVSVRTLVAARKRSHSQHRRPVDERTVLTGIVAVAERTPTSGPMATASIPLLTGRGVSAGEARGTIVHLGTLDAPRRARPADVAQTSTILVVPSLQLTWLGALATADAVIAERGAPTDAGAMLLHALSIPCVVGVPHALRILEEGEEVVVDATAGNILRTHLDETAKEAGATAPEDFARLAAPSADNLVLPRVDRDRTQTFLPKKEADLDATTADLDRTEPAPDLSTPFGVPHTMAVEPDQVESVEHDEQSEHHRAATGDATDANPYGFTPHPHDGPPEPLDVANDDEDDEDDEDDDEDDSWDDGSDPSFESDIVSKAEPARGERETNAAPTTSSAGEENAGPNADANENDIANKGANEDDREDNRNGADENAAEDDNEAPTEGGSNSLNEDDNVRPTEGGGNGLHEDADEGPNEAASKSLNDGANENLNEDQSVNDSPESEGEKSDAEALSLSARIEAAAERK